MLELAVLGLLNDSGLHGYELKKRLTELLGPWSSVSFGSLYPALARLERDGIMRAKRVNRELLGNGNVDPPKSIDHLLEGIKREYEKDTGNSSGHGGDDGNIEARNGDDVRCTGILESLLERLGEARVYAQQDAC